MGRPSVLGTVMPVLALAAGIAIGRYALLDVLPGPDRVDAKSLQEAASAGLDRLMDAVDKHRANSGQEDAENRPYDPERDGELVSGSGDNSGDSEGSDTAGSAETPGTEPGTERREPRTMVRQYIGPETANTLVFRDLDGSEVTVRLAEIATDHPAILAALRDLGRRYMRIWLARTGEGVVWLLPKDWEPGYPLPPLPPTEQSLNATILRELRDLGE